MTQAEFKVGKKKDNGADFIAKCEKISGIIKKYKSWLVPFAIAFVVTLYHFKGWTYAVTATLGVYVIYVSLSHIMDVVKYLLEPKKDAERKKRLQKFVIGFAGMIITVVIISGIIHVTPAKKFLQEHLYGYSDTEIQKPTALEDIITTTPINTIVP
jgi:hypothetical protein